MNWACKVCASTDGVWVCLTCGHVGCGRQAKHPELGGGHSRHHHYACGAGHECALDVVSKAVHCYACDDWVICDEPWLATLRGELEGLPCGCLGYLRVRKVSLDDVGRAEDSTG